jgi:hypothetical protein
LGEAEESGEKEVRGNRMAFDDYGLQKFYLAVEGAASSEKTLQERVADAFLYNLILIEAVNVPAEVWDRLQKMKAEVTKIPAKGSEGTIVATTSQMSTEEARKCLREIVSMYDETHQAYLEQERH